jgi:hypothetical protein
LQAGRIIFVEGIEEPEAGGRQKAQDNHFQVTPPADEEGPDNPDKYAFNLFQGGCLIWYLYNENMPRFCKVAYLPSGAEKSVAQLWAAVAVAVG